MKLRGLSCALALAASAAWGDSARWSPTVPRLVEAVDVPQEVRAMGIPMRLRAVRSQAGVDELSRHFLHVFAEAGLYVAQPQHQPQLSEHLQLTALDPRQRVAWSVILREERGGTTVIIGEADLAAAVDEPADFAPRFPGAAHAIRSRTESSRSLAYVTGAPCAEVVDFYRSVLPADGWVRRAERIFARPREHIRVECTAGRSGETTVVLTLARGVPPELSVPALRDGR